ncbi:hypothetical protein CMEL01_05620 [Colletotrichum melonis]|uniref:Uncharacterized protein n=1 Tax=Colletotrichum melonis TaxID=1209925 RepID=A0AAI9XN28_9PEZI|nr:hypothetical protein CMEL01_05620 [Colletotrichum melonis]
MGGNRREIRNRRSKVAFGGRVCLFLSLKRNSPSWPRIAAVTRRGFSGQRLVPSYPYCGSGRWSGRLVEGWVQAAPEAPVIFGLCLPCLALP